MSRAMEHVSAGEVTIATRSVEIDGVARHGQRLWLNMVAGGFKNDLAALNDDTPHDKRYQRLVEYALATNPGVVETFFRQELPMVDYFSRTWQKIPWVYG